MDGRAGARQARPMEDPIRFKGGFADLVGYRLEAWEEGYARLGLVLTRQHMNRSAVLHGGVVSTLIDTACGYAGTHSADPSQVRRSFTLQLTTQFLATAKAGEAITCEAWRLGGGRQIYFARAELRGAAGLLIGHGDGSFKYRGGSLAPPAP